MKVNRTYYTTSEVAERLGISNDTVRRLIKEGALEASYSPGKQARISEVALQKYERQGNPTPACQVVAFANQKGGVGKTTSAVAVAAALVDSGQRVLLIDTDPQASATDAVGFDRRKPYVGIHDAITAVIDEEDAQLPVVEIEPRWHLVPSHIKLAGMENKISTDAMNKIKILWPLIEPLRAQYDWIIIDCAPSLGWVFLNALMAADWVIIPQIPDSISVQGVGQLEETIRKVQKWRRGEGITRPLAVLGVLLTRVEHADHHRQIREQLAAFCADLGIPFLSARDETERKQNRTDRVEIPKTIAVADAFGLARPVSRYADAGAARDAYRKLAGLLLTQVGHPITEAIHA